MEVCDNCGKEIEKDLERELALCMKCIWEEFGTELKEEFRRIDKNE